MKMIITLLILVLVAVFIGLGLSDHQSYFLIVYHQVSIEIRFWLAILLFVVAVILLYILLRLCSKLWHIRIRLVRWQKMRRSRKGRQLMKRGLYAWAEGDYLDAEKDFVKSSQFLEHSFFNYIFSAMTANLQRAFDRRDSYLEHAALVPASNKLVLKLMTAQLQIDAAQWTQALITLDFLKKHYPKHPKVIMLLKTVYLKQKNYHLLRELLPQLQRTHLMDQKEWACLEELVYKELFIALEPKNKESLTQFWQTVPKRVQHSETMNHLWPSYLIRYGDSLYAEDWIQKVLKKQWDPFLVILYCDIKEGNVNDRLIMVEHWIKQYGEKPELLYSAGYLSMEQRFLKKAYEYLKASLKMKPTIKVYEALAQLSQQTEEKEMAIEYLKKACLLGRADHSCCY